MNLRHNTYLTKVMALLIAGSLLGPTIACTQATSTSSGTSTKGLITCNRQAITIEDKTAQQVTITNVCGEELTLELILSPKSLCSAYFLNAKEKSTKQLTTNAHTIILYLTLNATNINKQQATDALTIIVTSPNKPQEQHKINVTVIPQPADDDPAKQSEQEPGQPDHLSSPNSNGTNSPSINHQTTNYQGPDTTKSNNTSAPDAGFSPKPGQLNNSANVTNPHTGAESTTPADKILDANLPLGEETLPTVSNQEANDQLIAYLHPQYCKALSKDDVEVTTQVNKTLKKLNTLAKQVAPTIKPISYIKDLTEFDYLFTNTFMTTVMEQLSFFKKTAGAKAKLQPIIRCLATAQLQILLKQQQLYKQDPTLSYNAKITKLINKALLDSTETILESLSKAPKSSVFDLDNDKFSNYNQEAYAEDNGEPLTRQILTDWMSAAYHKLATQDLTPQSYRDTLLATLPDTITNAISNYSEPLTHKIQTAIKNHCGKMTIPTLTGIGGIGGLAGIAGIAGRHLWKKHKDNRQDIRKPNGPENVVEKKEQQIVKTAEENQKNPAENDKQQTENVVENKKQQTENVVEDKEQQTVGDDKKKTTDAAKDNKQQTDGQPPNNGNEPQPDENQKKDPKGSEQQQTKTPKGNGQQPTFNSLDKPKKSSTSSQLGQDKSLEQFSSLTTQQGGSTIMGVLTNQDQLTADSLRFAKMHNSQQHQQGEPQQQPQQQDGEATQGLRDAIAAQHKYNQQTTQQSDQNLGQTETKTNTVQDQTAPVNQQSDQKQKATDEVKPVASQQNNNQEQNTVTLELPGVKQDGKTDNQPTTKLKFPFTQKPEVNQQINNDDYKPDDSSGGGQGIAIKEQKTPEVKPVISQQNNNQEQNPVGQSPTEVPQSTQPSDQNSGQTQTNPVQDQNTPVKQPPSQKQKFEEEEEHVKDANGIVWPLSNDAIKWLLDTCLNPLLKSDKNIPQHAVWDQQWQPTGGQPNKSPYAIAAQGQSPVTLKLIDFNQDGKTNSQPTIITLSRQNEPSWSPYTIYTIDTEEQKTPVVKPVNTIIVGNPDESSNYRRPFGRIMSRSSDFVSFNMLPSGIVWPFGNVLRSSNAAKRLFDVHPNPYTFRQYEWWTPDENVPQHAAHDKQSVFQIYGLKELPTDYEHRFSFKGPLCLYPKCCKVLPLVECIEVAVFRQTDKTIKLSISNEQLIRTLGQAIRENELLKEQANAGYCELLF